MELNKISSFKSFSEMKKQQDAVKTEQDNKGKRVKSLEKISAILDELEITDMSELDEEKKRALVTKIFNEDRAEEIEKEIMAMGTEKDAIEDVLKKVEEDKAEEIEDKIKDLGEPEKEDVDDAEEVQADLYEATVTLDAMEPEEKSLVAFCKKNGIKWKIINMNGPAANYPEVEYVGKKKDLEKMINNFWGEDSGLEEFIEESRIFEAIQVEGKRDAGKVVTAYNRIFGKMLTDLGAMNMDSKIGCIKYLYVEAMIDANFGKEGESASSNLKGNISTLPIKMNGLGGHFVKIGATTIRTVLDNYTTDISGAASWRGIGITEGTALYLAQLGQEAQGQALLNAFNSKFEGEAVRVDITSKLNEALTEAKAKGLDWAISQLGDNAKCMDVASFVYDNYDKVTGLKKSMRDDEMDFPDEIMEIVDHYGLDIDEFTEHYGMAAESVEIDEARSINKIQKEWSDITAKMSAKAQEWKAAESDAKAALLDELKAMTAKKKALEAELNDAVAGKDKDLELVVSEGNAFGDAVTKAKEEGKDEFEFQGKTYKVEEGVVSIKGGRIIANKVLNKLVDMELISVKKKSEELLDVIAKVISDAKMESAEVNEGAVKAFEMDYADMEKSIKRGIGWIDPDYVQTTWENSSDSFPFDLVASEIYGRLIKAGLLWYADEETGEDKGTQVKSLKELGIKESVNEAKKPKTWDSQFAMKAIDAYEAGEFDPDDDKSLAKWEKEYNGGVTPKPGFDTYNIIAYALTSGKKPDGTPMKESMNEAFEVHYSDGVRAMQKFNDKNKAIAFMKDKIESNQKLQDIAVYNAGSGFNSTADTDAVISWWGDGSYLDNVSKKDSKLAAKKLDESLISEAEVKSDEEFKEYAFNVLQKAFGEEFDAEKAEEVVDGILKKCGSDYGACIGTLTSSLGESVTNEGIDVEYWSDYNTDTTGRGDSKFAEKSKDFEKTWKAAVKDWNDNNEMGEENEITPAMAKKVEKTAKEFFKNTGWISVNVAGAMIAQES